MSDDSPEPLDEYSKIRLRVAFRTRVEVLKEFNTLSAYDEPYTRENVREASQFLMASERGELKRRLKARYDRLEAICEGECKRFDEPHVESDDVDIEIPRA